MMKKPIRFNLQFQNGEESVQIRNLEDLEENMNLNDLLDSFHSGDLERWLRQRNETERADKVSALEHNDEEETLLKLFDVLDLAFPESEIREIVGRYTHQKAMAQVRHLILGSKEESPRHDSPARDDSLLQVYHEKRFEEYKQLKERIRNVPMNSPFSSHKVLIDELLNEYSDYFELEWLQFFFEMVPSYCGWATPSYEDAAEHGNLLEVLNKKSGLSDSQKTEIERHYIQTNSGLIALFLLWASAQWHEKYHILIDYFKQPSMKKLDLENLIICFKDKTDPYALPYPRNLWWQDKNRQPDFMIICSSNLDFYFYWNFGKANLAPFFDKPNEMNDDPERPIKLVNAATGSWPEYKWETLVERGKQIFVLYSGNEIELASDSTTVPDKRVYDGLRFRYHKTSGYLEEELIVFMEMKS